MAHRSLASNMFTDEVISTAFCTQLKNANFNFKEPGSIRPIFGLKLLEKDLGQFLQKFAQATPSKFTKDFLRYLSP